MKNRSDTDFDRKMSGCQHGKPERVRQRKAAVRHLAALALFVLLWAALQRATPAQAQLSGFLHTDGSQLVNAQGHRVILTGINWFGLETESFAPHGLWARNWESILDQVRELGFNTIRLPYSNELFDAGSMPNSVNYDLNPDLEGLSGLEIMDKIIEGSGERGIKIILDRHRPGSTAQSELWYTAAYDEQRWIDDWVMLAQRYAGNDTVIGADLHNEPHGPATWGTGDETTDWRLAAEKAGNAILAANADWLIIVQGIEQYEGDWYWWGGNLMGAGEHPVRLDVPERLVYSTHVYGPGVYPQPWFDVPEFPDNLAQIWDAHWGYLARENVAPIIVGEFGGRSVGEDKEGVWQRALFSYLREHSLSYFYWTLNPNSGDTGGLLLDDWESVDPDKQELLESYQFPPLGEEGATVGEDLIGEAATPAGDGTAVAAATAPAAESTEMPPAPAVREGALEVRLRMPHAATELQDARPEFVIVNHGTDAVPLAHVQVTYWLDGGGEEQADGGEMVFHCDWAAVGCSNVMGAFERGEDGTRYLRISFRPGAGSIEGGGDSGEIKVRFNRSDWAPFAQEGHYSFHPVAEYETWERVTLAVDGNQVWGVAPVDGTVEENGNLEATETSEAVAHAETPAATGTAEATATEPGTEVDVLIATVTPPATTSPGLALTPVPAPGAPAGGWAMMSGSGLLITVIALVSCAIVLAAIGIAIGVWYSQRKREE